MPFIRQKSPTPYQEKHPHTMIFTDVLEFLGDIEEKAAHCDDAKHMIAFGSGAQIVIRQTRQPIFIGSELDRRVDKCACNSEEELFEWLKKAWANLNHGYLAKF